MPSIIEVKRQNSTSRIDQLSDRLTLLPELIALPNLTIFVAGSYARDEASIYSDIDLFFVLDGNLSAISNHKISTMRAFSRIIAEADLLKFPAFSNDGEFLTILERPAITRELGGRNDDYNNYFTARMLLLLESKPIYGRHTYDDVIRDIVGAYFRDYTHHPRDFKPVFLINDIIRFWKTLCLNYEHKRNQTDDNREKIIKQKVKNFKLKFSRMLTCFGSIAAIVSAEPNSGPSEIISLLQLTPYDRLKKAADNYPELESEIVALSQQYIWFLEQTNVDEKDLHLRFSDKIFRNDAFNRAEVFGDSMYTIVKHIAERNGYLRYLLI